MTKRLRRGEVIQINRLLGEKFNTPHGLGGNASNLDYALSLKEPYRIAQEILRGHPFVDGNERTAFVVYVMLTAKKKDFYDVFQDFYDILLGLSKGVI